ncbi:MAG: cytidine/deoxycytidylate deaminase family protein [bacterium]
MKRPSWDQYFMQIAKVIATRSTCLRRQVGSIIVKNKRIISTGYNGTLSSLEHCQKAGCLREKLHIGSGERQELCRGMHAEANALLFAASYGVDMHDAALYCTHQPCVLCAKMIIQAGIKKVVYQGKYPDDLAVKLFREAKITLKKFVK